MIHQFKAADHPEAGGRQPFHGEQQWTLTLPLENGDDYLEVHIGKKGRDALAAMLEQEQKDDAASAVTADACSEYRKIQDERLAAERAFGERIRRLQESCPHPDVSGWLADVWEDGKLCMVCHKTVATRPPFRDKNGLAVP